MDQLDQSGTEVPTKVPTYSIGSRHKVGNPDPSHAKSHRPQNNGRQLGTTEGATTLTLWIPHPSARESEGSTQMNGQSL